jgi:hypothetical protein
MPSIEPARSSLARRAAEEREDIEHQEKALAEYKASLTATSSTSSAFVTFSQGRPS